ncbi:hypothetical protein HNE_0467 [Hyphomonas neptunium ATCC 15444]|uniref:Uncharacterized protein n=2 Tax=Hyphomonas TaxID=85 RepID=Q0C4Z6_HYPNA|nr:hypothetical protein HNE_0467 [Hyphomonas neptunium ATCC 15444]
MQKDAPMPRQKNSPAGEVKRKYAAPSPPRMILSAQAGDRRVKSALSPAKL